MNRFLTLTLISLLTTLCVSADDFIVKDGILMRVVPIEGLPPDCRPTQFVGGIPLPGTANPTRQIFVYDKNGKRIGTISVRGNRATMRDLKGRNVDAITFTGGK